MQVVKGQVIFGADIYTQFADIKETAYIPVINDQNIRELDQKLIRKNINQPTQIRGVKHFKQPVIVEKLQVSRKKIAKFDLVTDFFF